MIVQEFFSTYIFAHCQVDLFNIKLVDFKGEEKYDLKVGSYLFYWTVLTKFLCLPSFSCLLSHFIYIINRVLGYSYNISITAYCSLYYVKFSVQTSTYSERGTIRNFLLCIFELANPSEIFNFSNRKVQDRTPTLLHLPLGNKIRKFIF